MEVSSGQKQSSAEDKKQTTKKPQNKVRLISVSAIFLLLAIANGTCFILANYLHNKPTKLSEQDRIALEEAKDHLEKIIAINDACSDLFENNYLKSDVTNESFSNCYKIAKELGENNNSAYSNEMLSEAKSFLEYREDFTNILANFGTVDYEMVAGYSSEAEKELSTFGEPYQEQLNPLVDQLSEKVQRVEEAKTLVANIYNNGDVPESIDRSDYDYVRNYVDSIERDDVKSDLYPKLDSVEEVISERERIAWERAEAERLAREAAERERQARIAAAWHYIDIPNYISQNRNNVLNGCEAASLLMALQYKGYLNGISLYDYAQNMPKSDDPSTGFYLDIFGVEPRDVAHWIDTAPLAEYGRSSSGANVVDLRGSDLGAIAEDIINGNPVIIYLSYDYKQPYNWSDSSKMYKNVHVQLVTGYNTETGQFRIVDPWTRNNGNYTFYVDWGTVESVYNTVGKRAVAVRDGSSIALLSSKKLNGDYIGELVRKYLYLKRLAEEL